MMGKAYGKTTKPEEKTNFFHSATEVAIWMVGALKRQIPLDLSLNWSRSTNCPNGPILTSSIVRKWQPTPVFLPGESQGQGSLVGFRLWGHTESDTTEAT